MSDDASRYYGFSCPHETIDVPLLERIATTHYRRALRTFVARHSELVSTHGGGALVDLYRGWIEQPTDFETVWHLAFGEMREVLAEQRRPSTPADVLLAAALLGLRLCERGTTGRWSLALGAPARFRFDRWILPACDHIDVVAEQGSLRLDLADGGTRHSLSARAEASGWAIDGAAMRIPGFDTGMRSVGLLLPSTPEGGEHAEHPFEADAPEEQEEIARGYRSAFGILKEYAPIYLPFVDRLLRHLVPVKPVPGGYIGGGSLRGNPGTVKLPFEREPVGIAANLGHECAHQHYFLLRGAGRIDDGSDRTLYESAFVEGARDLPSVVLTYHAFANEALVLRTCEVGGIADPYAADRAERIRFNLEPLEEILAKSTALTPLGRALWEPVAGHLRKAFA